jgi:recombination protein RecR
MSRLDDAERRCFIIPRGSRCHIYSEKLANMPEALRRVIDMIHFLPGIGEKTAAKLAFFLLKANSSYVANFSRALADLHTQVHECEQCHAMTDMSESLCSVCRDPRRDSATLCIVEDYLDMLSIERT